MLKVVHERFQSLFTNPVACDLSFRSHSISNTLPYDTVLRATRVLSSIATGQGNGK